MRILTSILPLSSLALTWLTLSVSGHSSVAGTTTTSQTAAVTENRFWEEERYLKRTGGGGTKTRPSGSSGGGGGGGGSKASAPNGGNYVNGGLGAKYRSSSRSNGDDSSTASKSAQGSCCVYLCCSSGYRPGFRRYWYRGYRPTEEEGLYLEGAFENASMAMMNLAMFNETAALYTGDCALVIEPGDDDTGFGGLLVNRSVASPEALANSTNITVRAHLTDLSSRLNAFEWESEVDLHRDLRSWFLDYNALQPCFDDLSDESDKHASHVQEVRQGVQDAEDVANAWEQRLASASSDWRSWKLVGTLVSVMSIALAL